MNIENVLESIERNQVLSNYLLYGEEDFFIDKISDMFLKNIIPDSEKMFNEKILYGKDVDVFSLINTLKSFPITGQRQLIVLKEAQKLLEINELVNYLKHPMTTTIFIVCYKKRNLDKRQKWVKFFQQNGCLVESKKLYGKNFNKWIDYNLLEKNMTIEKKAVLLLLDFLGEDLSKITNAINKLSSIVLNSSITISDVQKHIGIHRDYNTFELQNALAYKNSRKVISIVNYFISNQKKFPLPLIIGVLFSFYTKLLIIHSLDDQSDSSITKSIKVHSFFLKVYKVGCQNYSFNDCVNIISLLKDADLKFKGIKNSFKKDDLKELVLRILS